VIVAFEIQTYQGGNWKIDSVYDDGKLAEGEAFRLQQRGRHIAIRVVEEKYDAAAERSTTRVVYKWAKSDSANAKERKRQVSNTNSVRQQQKAVSAAVDLRKAGARAARKKKENRSWWVSLLVSIGGIAVGAGVILVGIRFLLESL